jgi:hypothetical protein
VLGIADGATATELLELRPAVLVQHDQLAVDDDVRQIPKVRNDFGEEGEEVIPAPREHVYALAVFDKERSVAIVL